VSQEPLISVALPVRNAILTLPLALASIRAQTFEDWELLVMDDGSTDGSRRLADRIAGVDPRVRVLEPAGPSGLPARLNQAIDAARGSFFARMDADDIAYPERFALQMDFLRSHSEVSLLGTGMTIFDDAGRARGQRVAPARHEEICVLSSIVFHLYHPTWMGRIEWFRRHRYDETAPRAQDQGLLHRTFRESRFANLPELLLGYREARLPLKATLRGRVIHARRIAARSLSEGRPVAALTSIAGHAARGTIDAVGHAVWPEGVLRLRAKPLSPEQQARWRAVWELVNELAGSSAADAHPGR
jgi:glycosyltransferase involved in cell wall biosynthesis